MKFGKEFASQMVPEWQQAYMNYNHLKGILKDIMNIQQRNKPSPVSAKSPLGSPLKRGSIYRAFSGLTSRYASFKGGFPNVKEKEDEVILVSAGQPEVEEGGGSEGNYQTIFLRSSDEGGEYELIFFKRLDDEFNKVVKFYKTKVEEVMEEAQRLNKQMDALIALRFNIYYPDASASYPVSTSHSMTAKQTGMLPLDVIQEIEMNEEGNSDDQMGPASGDPKRNSDLGKGDNEDYRLASMEVLNHVKINVEPATLVSTLKHVWNSLKADLSYSKEELRTIDEQMKQAFIEFHKKLRLLKSYCFLNQLAFSKIMKKYDKITSRHASKAYLDMVDKSYLGHADEVAKLIERVEATFVKHFSNGNRHKGMNTLRPKAKREKHRVTFFLGFFSGCSVALVVAIVLAIHAGNLLNSEGRGRYMDTIFPLYSLFGFLVLHMLMYSGNIYFWKRFRVNYSFIFGFKPGTELGYREVLLLASGLSLLTLAAVLSNLEMDIDPRTESFKALTELVPLALVIVVLLIAICPFNIVYRTNRFFLLQCIWHCVCAPLYKVTLPDFFLADQLTSQVQSLRSLEFYVCYYFWGDFKTRSSSCSKNNVFQIVTIIVAVIPYWLRCLQCLRRLFEERDSMQGLNGLKYFSTILAVVARTIYDQKKEMSFRMTLKLIAASTSGVATIFNTYWDLVMDWGLLCRDSKNPWLRDKLLVPTKFVYFAAMVLNVFLRLAWMQTVLDFHEAPFLHRKALIAIVASLEIIRRGLWNFFRLENEHLNNVGKYRAFKSVPLPFSYEDEDKDR